MASTKPELEYVYSFIDDPSAFDSIEEWNDYVAQLKALPANHFRKKEMLDDAYKTMAWKRKHQMH